MMVAVLLVLTAIIPPASAYVFASWRIRTASTRAETAAGVLASRRAELRQVARGQDSVCGPGRVPAGAGDGLAWVQNPVAAGQSFESIWPQDPWGRCYLLNVRRLLDGHGGLLISAGPNGTIDTALDAGAPAGDDIGVLVR